MELSENRGDHINLSTAASSFASDEDCSSSDVPVKRQRIDGNSQNKHYAHMYFIYDRRKERSICQVQMPNKICSESISGKNSTNLIAHLRKKHPSLNDELAEKKKTWDSRITRTGSVHSSWDLNERQTVINHFFPKKSIKIKVRNHYDCKFHCF